MKYKIGDIVPFEQTQEATDWVNSVEGNYYLEDYERDENGNMQLIVRQLPQPTQEELEAQALAQAKLIRSSEVEALTVEVDGMVFDADETSQARMSVAASSMEVGETNVWVLHNNSIVQVSKEQLKQACRLARIAQSAIWTKPYEG